MMVKVQTRAAEARRGAQQARPLEPHFAVEGKPTKEEISLPRRTKGKPTKEISLMRLTETDRLNRLQTSVQQALLGDLAQLRHCLHERRLWRATRNC
mmetsp:Transcript_49352/g.107474  ORF Transcript_49352/g.107474 Transcript_49352/m.107474 type:complete len:97 (-) Transcript_49352:266-556(-)